MSRSRSRRDATRLGARITALTIVVLGLFAVAAVRVVYLHTVRAPWLRARAEEQRLRRIELLPARGTIYDRNRRELAKSIPGASVFVDPSALLTSSPGTWERLCAALGIDPDEAQKLLRRGGSRFAWLKRSATPREVEAVQNLRIPGVGVAREPQRYYPKKALAGQVLGFVGVDGKGLDGLEYRYDELLRGRAQVVQAERDARGTLLLAGVPDPAAGRGKSLVLTLDETIQHIAEEELARAVEKSRARGGIAAIMEPSTGDVLALAQVPAFNPNLVAQSSAAHRKIKAAVDVYEPGSTLKALFLGILLDRGVVRPSDRVFCENGQWRVHGRTLHDHAPYGWLTVADILKVSSNIGVAKLSERVEPQVLYDGLRAFGLGAPTEVGLPGESGGILPPPTAWSKISPMTIAYGQGVSITVLQGVGAFATVANRGVRMKPRLVRAVLDEQGRVVEEFDPQPAGRALSEGTASTLTRLMERVVGSEDGTGTRAAVPGYTVAGKTGTSWKPDLENGGYCREKVMASFAGFAPAAAPRIAALVVVDEPTRGSRYGGMVAAPAFREMARRTLAYLEVPPENEGGGDEAVVSTGRPPRSGTETPVGTMPDVVGLTMREVLRGLVSSGVSLEPSLLGSGVAATQDPAPGEPLKPGQKCRIVFRPVL